MPAYTMIVNAVTRLGTKLYSPFTPGWFDKSMFEFVSNGRGGRILNVGSGKTPHFNSQTVNLDIKPDPSVDIIADAHQLPFADASFDTVFCSATLEHTQRPWVVASEIQRVLRVRGIAVIQVPFLEGIHDEHDYFRFTPRGLISLFPRLRPIRPIGISASSAQILAELVGANIALVFEHTVLEKPVKLAMSWLVKPVQYLDLLFRRQNSTMIRHARAIYFVGRKKEEYCSQL